MNSSAGAVVFRELAVRLRRHCSTSHPRVPYAAQIFSAPLACPVLMLGRGPFSALALLILVLAFSVRFVAALWWDARLPAEQPFAFPDSESYWELGHRLAEGGPYEFRTPERKVFRAPGYPLLLAVLFSSFGKGTPVLAASVMGAALGTAAVGATIWWTMRLFDQTTGLVAGLLSALYPGAIAMSLFVLSEALFCPLMLLQLALWGIALQASKSRTALALAGGAGLIAAAASLTRPSWLLFTPVAAIALTLLDRNRHMLLVGAMVIAGLIVGMAPWWIRNTKVTGHFVPTTLQVGASLYDGLSPQADGSSNLQPAADFEARQRKQMDRENVPASEIEYQLDRRLRTAARDWAIGHPGTALRLALVKVIRMWNIWPNEPMFRSLTLRLAVVMTYVPLLLLGVAGAWRFSATNRGAVLAWLPAVYFTLVHAIFVGSLRYREPAMMALIVLAAAQGVHLWRRFVSGVRPQTT